jgi:TfoX/Sxy family transcriptional regulator of competence genes
VSTTPSDPVVQDLMDRVRASLQDRPVREVKMFGVRAIMVDNVMVVAVHRDGSLLVRVDPADDDKLLSNAHAYRAEMGAGRSMGQGWIHVEAEALRSDVGLTSWLDCALSYRSRLSRIATPSGHD